MEGVITYTSSMDGRFPCSEQTSKPLTLKAAFFGALGLSDDVFGEPAAASNSSSNCASSSPVEGAGGGSGTGSSSTGGSTGAGGGASSTASALGGIASPQNSQVPRLVGRFSNMQTGHSHFSPSSAIFSRGRVGGGRVGCLLMSWAPLAAWAPLVPVSRGRALPLQLERLLTDVERSRGAPRVVFARPRPPIIT